LQQLLTANPKYLLGFSDITAGLLAWQAAGFGQWAVHAPMAAHMADPQSPEALALIGYLQTGAYSLSWQDDTAATHPNLRLVAPITGGNLTLLAHSIGSKYPLEASGHILFLEEVGEQLYHIDRLLLQLKRAGALEGVLGVLLGHFTDTKDLPQGFGSTLLEIVRSYFPHVPVAAGLPAGHAQPNWPVPFGVEVVLKAEGGEWRLNKA
jgi:muramoyltetrapeptide carboxypeptidase